MDQKRARNHRVVATILLFLLSACNKPAAQESITPEHETESDITSEMSVETEELNVGVSMDGEDEITPVERAADLLYLDDFAYLGAFRLPEESNGSNWEYSGYAMTYHPDGDPMGVNDGFPGSLFAIGHDHQQYVSEISIPVPVLSKNLGELNTASTLQPFADITGGMFKDLEIPRAGLAYLPPQGNQTAGKLYFAWGQHYQFESEPSHGWSELDLKQPQPAGPWYVSNYTNYITNDYLFDIPAEWADANTPGLRLVTGRFRVGTWSGLGPAFLAIGPSSAGNPPPRETVLDATPLLLYGEPVSGTPEIYSTEVMGMRIYKPSDEWSGGAWLTTGEKNAVILVGTKAMGANWYGFANGVIYPTSGDPDEAYPEVPPWPYDERGWWSEEISGQIIFYDPDDLSAVANGELETWEPQPYATMSLDSHLFDPGFDYERGKRYLLGAAAFDREQGYLYIIERQADEEKSLIHVFQIVGD